MNIKNHEHQEVKNSFWDYSAILTSNFSLILLSFISSTIMARALGPKGLGTFALFQMFVGPAFIYLSAWTGSAALRYCKEEYMLANTIYRVFWARNFIMLLTGFIILPAMFSLRGFITSFMGLPAWSFWLLVAYVIIMSYYNFLEYVFQSMRLLKRYALMRSLEKLFFVTGLLLIVFNALRGDVITVVIISMSGMLLLTLLGFISVGSGVFRPVKTDRETITRVLRFAAPMLIGGTCTYIVNWVDVIVIKTYLSVEKVGIYSLAYQGMTVVQQVSMSAIAVLSPMIVALKVKNREDLVERYAARFVPQGMFFWVIFVSLLMPVSAALIPLIFGKAFSGTVLPFNILMIGIGANFISSLFTPLEHAYELTRKTQKAFIAIALINIAGDIFLIPRIGIAGAALATAAAFLTGFYWYGYICARRAGVSIRTPLLLSSVTILSFILFNSGFPAALELAFVPILLAYSVILARYLKIFNRNDESIFEQIHMPSAVRALAVKAYRTKLLTGDN